VLVSSCDSSFSGHSHSFLCLICSCPGKKHKHEAKESEEAWVAASAWTTQNSFLQCTIVLGAIKRHCQGEAVGAADPEQPMAAEDKDPRTSAMGTYTQETSCKYLEHL